MDLIWVMFGPMWARCSWTGSNLGLDMSSMSQIRIFWSNCWMRHSKCCKGITAWKKSPFGPVSGDVAEFRRLLCRHGPGLGQTSWAIWSTKLRYNKIHDLTTFFTRFVILGRTFVISFQTRFLKDDILQEKVEISS